MVLELDCLKYVTSNPGSFQSNRTQERENSVKARIQLEEPHAPDGQHEGKLYDLQNDTSVEFPLKDLRRFQDSCTFIVKLNEVFTVLEFSQETSQQLITFCKNVSIILQFYTNPNESLLSQSSTKKRKNTKSEQNLEEDNSNPKWYNHKLHFFLVSNSGKPIYSRYGDEQKLAPFFASLVAIVEFGNSIDQKITYLSTSTHICCFFAKGPLLYVIIAKSEANKSSDQTDLSSMPSFPNPSSQNSQLSITLKQAIMIQLRYADNLVGAMLTHRSIERLFMRSTRFDLRRLFVGIDQSLGFLLKSFSRRPSMLLLGIDMLLMKKEFRDKVTEILKAATQSEHILFAGLIRGYELVAVRRRACFDVHPLDLQTVLALAGGWGGALRGVHTWTPLCLPTYNDNAFLNAFFGFVDSETYLVIITTESDALIEMSKRKAQIVDELKKLIADETFFSEKILKQANDLFLNSSSFSSIKYFAYRNNLNLKIVESGFSSSVENKQEKKRILKLLQHGICHFQKEFDFSSSFPKALTKFKYLRQCYEKETVYCMTVLGGLFFVVGDFMLDPQTVQRFYTLFAEKIDQYI